VRDRRERNKTCKMAAAATRSLVVTRAGSRRRGLLLSKFDSLLIRKPVLTNAVLAGGLGISGDFICQVGIEGKSFRDGSFEWRRCLGLGTFSAFYSRVNLALYKAYPKCIPASIKKRRWTEGFCSSLLDNLVHSPLLYLPSFFVWTGAVEGKSISTSLEDMERKFAPIFRSLLLFWVPVNTICFAAVPKQKRLLFVGVANLLWNAYLDLKQHH